MDTNVAFELTRKLEVWTRNSVIFKARLSYKFPEENKNMDASMNVWFVSVKLAN